MRPVRLFKTPIVYEQNGSRTFSWPQCTELSEAGCFNMIVEGRDFVIIAIECEDPMAFMSLPEFKDTIMLSSAETQKLLTDGVIK